MIGPFKGVAICISAACACACYAALLAARRARSGQSGKADGQLAPLRKALLKAFRDIKNSREWDQSSACILLSGGLDSALVAEVGGSKGVGRARGYVPKSQARTGRCFLTSFYCALDGLPVPLTVIVLDALQASAA